MRTALKRVEVLVEKLCAFLRVTLEPETLKSQDSVPGLHIERMTGIEPA